MEDCGVPGRDAGTAVAPLEAPETGSPVPVLRHVVLSAGGLHTQHPNVMLSIMHHPLGCKYIMLKH